MKLRWTLEVMQDTYSLPGLLPKVRWFWWCHILHYGYEICHRCGRPVSRCIGTWWSAPDKLWMEIDNGRFGILCPRCVIIEGKRPDRHLYFVLTEEKISNFSGRK